jgi:hypothetical protein
MVPWWPKQGQGVRYLVLIGCARGLDAQAESWRLQGHIDSGCQKEALFVLRRVACPGSRADSAVKTRYVVPCGLALATSQPSGQHGTGPGYSLCRQFLVRAVARTISGPPAAGLRTPIPAAELDGPGVVTAYKNLKYVERDFRHIKSDDLDLRPVFHRWNQLTVAAPWASG